jgi:hypothetical protein
MTRTLPNTEPGPLSSIAYRKRSSILSNEWQDLAQFSHFLYRRSGTRLAQYIYDPPFTRPSLNTNSTYSKQDASAAPRDLTAIEPAARFRRIMESGTTDVIELGLVVYGFNADVRCTPHVRTNDTDTALTSFNTITGSGWSLSFEIYDYRADDIQNQFGDLSNVYMELDTRSSSEEDPASIYHIEVRASTLSSPSLAESNLNGIPT